MNGFDTRVDRIGMSTVKQAFTPASVASSGIISLWGAEFEFPTAPFVIDAVVKWAQKGLYAYTVEDNHYRELVRQWMHNVRRWDISADWIVPVYGITASLATLMRTITEPGDGIIGLDPGYHMYWKAVELSGRRKVTSRMLFDGDSYSVDWDDLQEKMADPANKILLVCNPSNPTGKVFSSEELTHFSRLAAQYNVIIFNDEIFAECIYPGGEMHTFGQLPVSYTKIVTATSLGKWLSFTGTNQANLIIPDEQLRAAFLAERDREFYGSMNPMMLPAYYAAYTPEGAAWADELMRYVAENYHIVDEFFRKELPTFRAISPQGTFILWVDARAFCADEAKLIRFFNEQACFHVDPGTQYGGDPGFFRMTLSVPRAELKKALSSLKQAAKACNGHL